MPDIMKFIVNEGALDKDPAGNLISLNDWSEDIARKLAREMNLELKADHWEVINFLRDLYRQQGQPPFARDVLHALEARFEKYCDAMVAAMGLVGALPTRWNQRVLP